YSDSTAIVAAYSPNGRHEGGHHQTPQACIRSRFEEPAMAVTAQMETATVPEDLVRVGVRDELPAVTVVSGGRHGIAVFAQTGSDAIHAVDNRCPHMGFPLDRGSVCDGILTCHWHHAR